MWLQASAQTIDILMALGGNMEHRHLPAPSGAWLVGTNSRKPGWLTLILGTREGEHLLLPPNKCGND